MQTTTQLLNLKALAGLYAPCWQEWCQYQFNGLTEHDIYVIDNLRAADFKQEPGKVQMFYFQEAIVEETVTRLKSNLAHYQEWVLIKFWFGLLNRLDKNMFDHYFGTAFDELPLSPQEKTILKKFGVGSINQLIKTYSDEHLKQPQLFGLVLRFYSIQLQTKTIAT